MAASTTARPAAHLSREARSWWRSIAALWDLEPHHRALLDQAATALDRAREAREVITREGAVMADRFGQAKAHPAARVDDPRVAGRPQRRAHSPRAAARPG